jgi:hypothetical protein
MNASTKFLACALLTCLWSSAAEAQARRNVRPPIAKYQPYTSPYLNMLGPGGPGFGYFTGTLPQEQFRQQQYNFGRDFRNFENQVNDNFRKVGEQQSLEIRRTISTTGHPTSFQSYGGFFPGRR